MKGESPRPRRAAPGASEPAMGVAIEVFAALVGSPERTGRFLAATGLEADAVRRAAGEPGFWSALLDHVAADEHLLLDLAAETGIAPARIMAARQALAPAGDGELDA